MTTTQTATITCSRCRSLACNCGDQPYTYVEQAAYAPKGNRKARRKAASRKNKQSR